ncbi:MAG: type VI secretion system Vgr family protein [Aquabacterium sp.]|uniref:type VI secretion system Vgr family protein n=1 Tax=Aquabacterium sp. TaxID=1872578 RepID=UPI003BD05A94
MNLPGSSGWLERPSLRAFGIDWLALLQTWRSDARLYRLDSVSDARALPTELMVERFVLDEAVSEPFSLHIQALVLDAHVELKQLYARPVTLWTTLADGRRTRRSGYVTDAWSLEADGGLARKALLVRPWMALLGHTLNSRVWQDQTVMDIVDGVLAEHPDIAAWRWDDDVRAHVANGLFARNEGLRSYCVQYRESDLAFIQRLLAEEGIAWRVVEDDQAPGGHTVVFFVCSGAQDEDATSASALGGPGIRFHGSSSQEEQDSIQALMAVRQLAPTATVLQGWDYKANAAITTEVSTDHEWASDEVRSLQNWLSAYDPTGDFLWSNQAEAQFAARCLQEAHEARYKTWLGHGTVRTLRAGTWAAVTQSTQDQAFFFTRVRALGINNLPKDAQNQIERCLGEAPWPDDSVWMAAQAGSDWSLDDATWRQRAVATGFACQFEAVRREVPWRPVLMDETGFRPRPRPTALGMQTAIVVGPEGDERAHGADEVYTDALGRVRVRFHWQDGEPRARSARDSCWLRVVQRSAAAGGGHQFIPRVGQEVLVGFLNHDMDRPFVLASLYNGQGASGEPPTPGGEDAVADRRALADSTDHQPASQMNVVGQGSGGHSPAWHGAAPGVAEEGALAQNNAAAMSGVKSKEWGGSGFNQWVMDDTPGQLRTQLHSTQHQTWLQMGHLLHQADNHRGSFRGLGFELRTDAWGGVRAARGVLLSTYGLNNGLGQTGEGAGDNAAGIALAKQMQQLASTFHQAASTHQTVGLASAAGSSKANQSALEDALAPVAALTKSLSGMVSHTSLPNAVAHAADKHTGTEPDKVPHMADPNIAIVGKAGIGITAGQDLHISSNDTTTVGCGQDTHFAVGGQARVHTGQAIGILAGAIQPGSEAAGKGLTLIAAQGPIDMQAQAGPAQIAAKQTLELKTANGVVNIAAAKKVVLAVSGGASITMECGNLTVQCPGKITVKAGTKSMVGGDRVNHIFPDMPANEMYAAAFVVKDSQGHPVAGKRYVMTLPSGEMRMGQTDAHGQTVKASSSSPQPVELALLDGDEWHQTEVNSAHQEMDKYWSQAE